MDIQRTTAAASISGAVPVPTPLAGPVEALPPAAASRVEELLPALTVQALRQSLSDAVQGRATALEFSIDKSTHEEVVVVRDAETGDVIFQCPSEEALRMIRNLKAGVGGLVDQRV